MILALHEGETHSRMDSPVEDKQTIARRDKEMFCHGEHSGVGRGGVLVSPLALSKTSESRCVCVGVCGCLCVFMCGGGGALVPPIALCKAS